jgi:hypothetical protein
MNITEFKRDDIIVRTGPSKDYGNGHTDRSYIGERAVFVSIANGCIYVRINSIGLGERLVDLAVDVWDEDWQYWVDPVTLIQETQIEKDPEL